MFDIKTATVEQCKALAYDFLGQIQKIQNDLNILNQAIAEKSKANIIKPKKMTDETPVVPTEETPVEAPVETPAE